MVISEPQKKNCQGGVVTEHMFWDSVIRLHKITTIIRPNDELDHSYIVKDDLITL